MASAEAAKAPVEAMEPEDGAVHASSIKAVIRVRPQKEGETTYIESAPRKGNQLVAASLDYTKKFATVLGPSASQSDVFRTVGLPLVEATLKGHRTCLFAYGQTGAGKTFSMYGAEGGRNP